MAYNRRPGNNITLASDSCFTLIEMLIVVSVVGILAGLLLPALISARRKARVAQCQSNLHQIGMAIFSYAEDWHGMIPARSAFPTNKVWNDGDSTPDALGLLASGRYLRDNGVFFCPLQPENDAGRDGRRIGGEPGQAGGDVYCSYVYRQHAVGTGTFHIERPGRNPDGKSIRALALDSSCPPWPRIAHANLSVNILFHDGSVATESNLRHDYSVMDVRFYPLNAEGVPPVLAETDKIFINADAAYAR